jgi:nucleoside-diphosphate-sugar epimerase
VKRVLVTGGTGFIGSRVLPQLVEAGYEVHAVSSKPGAAAPAEVQWHVSDLLSAAEQRALLAQVAPTHILHLAWHVPPGKFWTATENVLWLNASLSLLQQFAEVDGQRWVSAGTCAEYDWSGLEEYREGDPCRPSTLYGACKHALSSVSIQMGKQSGVQVASGRIFYPYGPGETASRLTAATIRSLLAGKPAQCTAGLQIRDFLFVEDVARAFVTLLGSDHEGPVNVASGVPVTVREVVSRIAEIIGRPDLLLLGAIPTPKFEPARLIASVAVLESLGFRKRYDLDRGLRQTIEWWSKLVGVEIW